MLSLIWFPRIWKEFPFFEEPIDPSAGLLCLKYLNLASVPHIPGGAHQPHARVTVAEPIPIIENNPTVTLRLSQSRKWRQFSTLGVISLLRK